MNPGKICVSICGERAEDVIDRVRSAGELADVIEVRFDCVDPGEVRELADKLAATVATQLLLTYRPAEQGGKRRLTITERLKFWEFALSRFKDTDFLIDYEFDMDFPLQLDDRRAIVSVHDFDSGSKGLPQQVDALIRLTGKTIKIAVAADDATDAIEVWKLLGTMDNAVIPIAMGEAGKWTRILGLAHGAPMTYASLESGGETATGQIPVDDLRDVFSVKELDEDTRVYGVIAGNTSYSLSPYMHNAAFKHVGLNSVFIPLQVSDLDQFIRRMVKPDTREIELNFKGFSVTNPHKQAIIRHLDLVDETAQKIGAVNTVKFEDGKLHGYNTDAPGFIAPLREMYGDLSDARAAVVGAGGAARAVVYALKQEGVDVTLFARDPDKAAVFADEFGIKVEPLTTEHRRLAATDFLVNTTPLGTRGEYETGTIATTDELVGVKLVYDLVYNPEETRLLREAKAAGAKTLGGMDMLIAQGVQQFAIWTGQDAPADLMKAAVTNRLNKTNAA